MGVFLWIIGDIGVRSMIMIYSRLDHYYIRTNYGILFILTLFHGL